MRVNTTRCPVCREVQYLPAGELVEHYRNDKDYGQSICIASGLSLEEAESLEDRLRKAAHP